MLALALWKIKVVIALLFLGFIVAAAMRPGVDWLAQRARVPRAVGVLIHYAAFLGAIGLFLWLAVPPAIDQLQQAIGPSSLHHEAVHSTGIKHEILSDLDRRLRKLPSGRALVHPALTITRTAFEVVIGIFFMFATAAYWIFERDNAIALVQELSPSSKRRLIRDTWVLIDQKLGAFVRGELLLVALVGIVLSASFWAIGLPYWLLIGPFAGVFELVPVIGPIVAGALAIGVGLTQSPLRALAAGIVVLAVRMLEDYAVIPKVLGHATGVSPLAVLVSVSAVGFLFGGFYVLLAIPIAAVAATLIDVVARDVDPAEEEVPTVLFAGPKEEAS